MAAGLGFKDFVTGEVLTAADVDGYLMQGIWVFATATARDAAVTSPQEGNFAFTKDNNSLWYYDGAAWVASGATGDIEGVTAGIGISGGGTSGTVTVTNSMATAIDAKGDLVAGTGADTFAKLTVGANDTVLTADSTAATGLKWATPAAGGGMTLINTGGTTLTGASVSITSIPSTYKNLQLLIRNYKPANDTTNLRATFNSTSGYNGVYVGVDENRSPTGDADLLISRTQDNSVAQGVIVVQIFDYADTNTFKTMFTYAITNNATTSSNVNFMCGQSVFGSTTAISSIQIFPASGNFTSGTAFLYGVS
jgi:hypothetical protein